MKIYNLTLYRLLLIVAVLYNSLIFYSKAQANPACNDPNYLMQLRCRELQEFEQRNQWNRRMGILKAQERRKKQKQKLIIAGVTIGLVTIGTGTLLFKFINKKKSKSKEA